MQLDEQTIKYLDIFQPGLLETYKDVLENDTRFAYYTSAETAMKILNNKEIWFRNATAMNDFSEISYGLDLIESAFSGMPGKKFRDVVEEIYPGTMDKVEKIVLDQELDWRVETFIACVSVHENSEDYHGRLSMWRAYGNTALVIKNTPMVAVTDLLAVYSTPVLYVSRESFGDHLTKIAENISGNKAGIVSGGQDYLISCIFQMLFRFAIATKHPGFKEEKEWRLYYSPTIRQSVGMTSETVVLDGIPQIVQKLHLASDPSNGLFGADIPNLLDRIIVGPTEYPYVTKNAFVGVLKDLGADQASDKVVISDIPIRTE